MDDAACVRVRERVEDLDRRLDRRRVVELAGAHRLAERAARNVLVRDVHVLRVAPEPVGALTAGMTQARRRLGLALRTRRGLSLARNDLERDVQAGLLVARQPDRPRAAAAERSERAVPPEDELALEEGWGGVGHQLSWVGQALSESCPAGPRVRVTAASAGPRTP